MSRKHHELLAWQEAMALVTRVYAATAGFPAHEAYGLTSQMRRAAISVPSNIAEGAGRSGRKEFLQFLSVSRGSLSELETQFLIAKELGYLHDLGDLPARLDRLFGLLGGLMNSLRRPLTPRPPEGSPHASPLTPHASRRSPVR